MLGAPLAGFQATPPPEPPAAPRPSRALLPQTGLIGELQAGRERAGLDLGPGQLVSGHLEREVTVIKANMAPLKGSHAPLQSFPFWTCWLVGRYCGACQAWHDRSQLRPGQATHPCPLLMEIGGRPGAGRGRLCCLRRPHLLVAPEPLHGPSRPLLAGSHTTKSRVAVHRRRGRPHSRKQPRKQMLPPGAAPSPARRAGHGAMSSSPPCW